MVVIGLVGVFLLGAAVDYNPSKAVGLDGWVAADDEGYIAIAQRFAANPTELAALRERLPAQVSNSAAGN